MIDRLSFNKCVGCKACGDACPVDAITFERDKEGFWYPSINAEKCIKCEMCEKACPILQLDKVNNTNFDKPKVYSAHYKEKDIRYNSTSGGVYYALAKNMLEQGGYLVGCAYSDDYSKAEHIIVNDETGLKKVMRSKYFQSDTEGVYKETHKLLKRGEKVLFCGCPCQVAALKQYIGHEYENLYTVDFVCRGINSPLAYEKFIEELEDKYNSKVKEVHFKNKSHGWTNLGTKVTFENGKAYYRNRYTDPWVNAFIAGNFCMRPSCEQCDFKKLPRVSDLTIGDFWGLEFTREEAKYGVSLVMVNSMKGKDLFNSSMGMMVVEEKTLEEALNGNPAILNCAKFASGREEFFERIENEPFSKVIWSTLKSNVIIRNVKSIVYNVKDAIFRK